MESKEKHQPTNQPFECSGLNSKNWKLNNFPEYVHFDVMEVNEFWNKTVRARNDNETAWIGVYWVKKKKKTFFPFWLIFGRNDVMLCRHRHNNSLIPTLISKQGFNRSVFFQIFLLLLLLLLYLAWFDFSFYRLYLRTALQWWRPSLIQ